MNGEFYHWVDLPEVSTIEEVMNFDARICRSGFKEFLRKISNPEKESHPAEIGEELNQYEGVIVREISPGIRFRVFVKKAHKIGNG